MRGRVFTATEWRCRFHFTIYSGEFIWQRAANSTVGRRWLLSRVETRDVAFDDDSDDHSTTEILLIGSFFLRFSIISKRVVFLIKRVFLKNFFTKLLFSFINVENFISVKLDILVIKNF